MVDETYMEEPEMLESGLDIHIRIKESEYERLKDKAKKIADHIQKEFPVEVLILDVES